MICYIQSSVSNDRHTRTAAYPGIENDKLYESNYRHKHQDASVCGICADCSNHKDAVCPTALIASCRKLGCDDRYLVPRRSRASHIAHVPVVHFGRVASGDKVMKSGVHRDSIARQEKVIAFEMEAAGVWEMLPTMMIKSVCDYSDSHKSKNWQLYTSLVAAACLKAIVHEWRSPFQNPSASRLKELSYIALRSLSFPNINSRMVDIAFAHRNTCDWLFKTDEYRQWWNRETTDNGGVLWIKGKPGVGKSTLVKHTFLHCQDTLKDHVIAYYFFNARGGGLENSIPGLFRSLVYQLIKRIPALFDEFIKFYLDLTCQGTIPPTWNPSQLRNFLVIQMKRRFDQAIIIFIDALDECAESDIQDVVSFLGTLSINAIDMRNNLRICLSSRHYPTITIPKKIEIIVENQLPHEHDLQIYVTDNLVVSNPYNTREVARKSNGVFMWVVLVVGILNHDWSQGRVTINYLQQKLDKTQPDIETLYQEILERNNENLQETMLILFWMLFRFRVKYFTGPIRPDWLYYAVLAGCSNTDPQDLCHRDIRVITDDAIERFVVAASRGLIELRLSEGAQGIYEVHFVHQTVVDFLLRDQRLRGLDPSLGPDITGGCNDRLAECCAQYIRCSPWNAIRRYDELGTLRNFPHYTNTHGPTTLPFLNYAYEILFSHMDQAEKGGASQISRLRALSRDEPLLSRLFQYFITDGGPSRCTQCVPVEDRLMYLLAHSAQSQLLRVWLEDLASKPGANNRENHVRRDGGIIQAAISAKVSSSLECVEILLHAGADVNYSGGHFGNALQMACKTGDTGIIECLLDRGAHVNANQGFYGTALQAAAASGHRQAVSLLLEAGADVNIIGGCFGTALQAAVSRASSDNNEIVRELLKAGADMNLQGGVKMTPIQAARHYKYPQIVRILEEHSTQ